MIFRKNHQRALDSMQASLEAEARGKAEAMRIKKKLEADINELEIALDGANRGRAEAEKNIRRYQMQCQELQRALEDEQRARDEAREQYQVIIFHASASSQFPHFLQNSCMYIKFSSILSSSVSCTMTDLFCKHVLSQTRPKINTSKT